MPDVATKDCFPCKGTGKQLDRNKKEVVCPGCKGTGVRIRYKEGGKDSEEIGSQEKPFSSVKK